MLQCIDPWHLVDYEKYKIQIIMKLLEKVVTHMATAFQQIQYQDNLSHLCTLRTTSYEHSQHATTFWYLPLIFYATYGTRYAIVSPTHAHTHTPILISLDNSLRVNDLLMDPIIKCHLHICIRSSTDGYSPVDPSTLKCVMSWVADLYTYI